MRLAHSLSPLTAIIIFFQFFFFIYILSVRLAQPLSPHTTIVIFIIYYLFLFLYLRTQRDEDGYEAGAAPKPTYGYSLVQGRRPYMEDFIYSTLQYGQDKVCVCVCVCVCARVIYIRYIYIYILYICYTHAHTRTHTQGSCFFGCFDGHCGKRAAMWAKEHLALVWSIVGLF